MNQLFLGETPAIQAALIDTLDNLGPDARPLIPALIKTLRSPQWGIRAAIIKALTRIEGTAVLSLRKAAQGDDPSVRLYALDALGLLGELGKNGLPSASKVKADLLQALHNPDPDLAAGIPARLSGFNMSREEISALMTALGHPEKSVRLEVAKALQFEHSPSVMERLADTAKLDSDREVRNQAAMSLWLSRTVQGQHLSAVVSVGKEKAVCRYIQQLKATKQLQFEYPNSDGPKDFSKWSLWRWPSSQQASDNFLVTEVDINDDGMQEVLLKHRSWGMHGYVRTEYNSILSGKDLSPYFLESDQIDEASIDFNPMHYDSSGISTFIPDIQSEVSESARFNQFSFKSTHYILVDEEDLIVGRYRSGGRIEVECYISAARTSKKKRS